ncbi:hypothetical protein [Oscillatoria acuminata]|uniref:Uncharacterized protein n=1 Tax=Oscillatoria acuminata PCC 6304 TaxID=56110 RepID=K9THP1_9CYAN|nr:hypothetical protein [Oscillatoria acuminata]AFY81544.1 hypothetical protein Oscil6304_1871 [Oscillatoria acuminata PCC 6304]
MEDWPKEFFTMLETAGQEMDRFFQEVTEEVEEFVDILGRFSSDIMELSEEFTEELQTTIFTELDQYFEELVDPFFDLYLGLDEFPTDMDGFVSSVEPTSEKYSACIGCKNYHGQVYGGNLLVCGMHPYGWEADGDCPDWES